jgi:CO/xanthine dehydrogenase FAD-binding subunit
MNLRLASPAVVVDVNRVDGLDGVGERNGELRLGALVRQRVLERDGRIRRACPMLAEAAPLIGHVAIRNRGTVGGSLAHADPAAELPAIATALGATVELASVRGRRALGAAELFVMPLVTTIEPDELLVSVRLPAAAPRTGQAWLEVSERHGDFALAGVGASVSLAADGTVAEVRLACAGVAPVPFDAQDAAAVLVGEAPSPELVAEAGERAAAACEPASDTHASEAFRRRLAGVLTRRALTRALEDAASR